MLSNLLSQVSSPIVQAGGLRGVEVPGPTRRREWPTLDRPLLTMIKTSPPQLPFKLVILQLIRRRKSKKPGEMEAVMERTVELVAENRRESGFEKLSFVVVGTGGCWKGGWKGWVRAELGHFLFVALCSGYD